MLVLTRRLGEVIVIGEGVVRVTVLAVAGRKVKLGIEAPEGVPVFRAEVGRPRPRPRASPGPGGAES